jgi:hypothetical protein
LNDENLHYLVEKVENLDVDNIDVDTVNDVVLNCNSIIKNAANITQNRIKLSNIEV